VIATQYVRDCVKCGMGPKKQLGNEQVYNVIARWQHSEEEIDLGLL
jgi:hypothetical protein